jgi:proteic killer suppression protein
MDISYVNSKIRKICTDARIAQKVLGKANAEILQERLKQIRNAKNLAELRLLPGAYHELKADRKGEIACSLLKRARLIFIPANDPRPTKPDGGLDWTQVTAIVNLEIVDYHK